MKIENRQQFLIVLVAIAAGLFLGDNLIYEPMAKWWSARQQRIVELRKKVSEGNLLIRRDAALRGRWNDWRANALPGNTSQAEQQLFKSLDNWSRETGVAISGIMPQWKNDSDDYMTLNCRVEAAGNLETLSRFLFDIEKDPMALKVDSVELSAKDNTGQQLTLGLQISGLVLNSQVK
jgi:Tfp pilus assembly protein PilO